MKARMTRQDGSVSLFMVIFVALLIITIATAFLRIMIQDQMQAASSDLSKSALDSAHAGVEDTKRAIVEYYRLGCQKNEAGESTRCPVLRAALEADIDPTTDGWTTGCQATVGAGVASLTNDEVLVKTDDADDDLNQAYTCIKVQMNPPDILGALTPGVSKIYKLESKDNAPISQIKLQWYSQQGQNVDLPNDVPYELPDVWPDNRPAVMKAQLLQYRGSFQSTDFDTDSDHNATLFLLPSLAGASTTAPASFLLDSRQNQTSDSAQPVACHPTQTASRYACEVTINVPCAGDPCDDYPTANNDRTAYLKLSQFYSTINTDFRITMLDTSGNEVRFANVQPAVDSTGRANDIFRRIRSRIDIGGSSVPTPEAAVDVTRRLCKEFLVTNDKAFPGNHTSACQSPPSNP